MSKFNYHIILPPSSLEKFIRFFWILEGDILNYTHRSLADTCCELVFHYQGKFDELSENNKKRLYDSGIQGQSNTISKYITDGNFGIFGVYLYPYAIPSLFNLSATELTNQQVSLIDLLGIKGKILEERMLLASGNEERLSIISSFLKVQLYDHKHHPVIDAIHFAKLKNGHCKVSDMATKFSMSERNFSRKFKEYSGFTPQLFFRICKFQYVAEKYKNKDFLLTDIAHRSGYFDQSHFIKDFKEFSGYKPKEFFSPTPNDLLWLNDQ